MAKLAILFLLSLLSILAASTKADEVSEEQLQPINPRPTTPTSATLGGYVPNVKLANNIFTPMKIGILPKPKLLSLTKKAQFRGARVRMSPNNFFMVGMFTNVTDDMGVKYAGAFPVMGQWNQSAAVSRIRILPGVGDFATASGVFHIIPYSMKLWQVRIQIRFNRWLD